MKHIVVIIGSLVREHIICEFNLFENEILELGYII